MIGEPGLLLGMMNQVPLEGRKTAMSAFPSPSKSPVVRLGIQVPRFCKPEVRLFTVSSASMKWFFNPMKSGWKVKSRFTVRLVPDPVAEEAPAFSTHWLFCSVPGWPIINGPSQLLPSSFFRYKLLLAGWNLVPHEPIKFDVVLRTVCTTEMF